MKRYLLSAALLVSACITASAQAYNPAGPSIPGPAIPAMPSAATPGMEPPPALIGRNSETSQTNARPNISLGSPGQATVHDRSVSCSHQAAALGVPGGSVGQYTRDCINSP